MIEANVGSQIIKIIGVFAILFFVVAVLCIRMITSKDRKYTREKLEDYDLPLYSVPILNRDKSVAYLGYHTTSIFTGVSWYSEMLGNFTNTFGGKSRNFEMEYEYIKKEALKKFKIEVLNRFPDVNSVINLHMDFEVLNLRKGVMFALVVSGDAIRIN